MGQLAGSHQQGTGCEEAVSVAPSDVGNRRLLHCPSIVHRPAGFSAADPTLSLVLERPAGYQA